MKKKMEATEPPATKAPNIMGDDMSPSEIKKTAEKCKEQDIEADEVSRGRFRDKDMPSKPESKESGDSGEKGAESGEEGDEADSSADGAEGAEGEAESGEEGDESCDGSSKDAKATDKTNEEGEMPERGDHTDNPARKESCLATFAPNWKKHLKKKKLRLTKSKPTTQQKL